jgi:hypothetical protein
MHTAESLVLEPSDILVDIAIELFRMYKLPDTDQNPAGMI